MLVLAGIGCVMSLAERARDPAHATTSSFSASSEPSSIVHFAGGGLRIDFDPAEFAISQADLETWVRQSAQATAAYFGRFPVPYARISFEPIQGDQVLLGQAVGHPEPRIVVTMGRRTSFQTLQRESLLVHEMVHLGVPDHDIRYLWLHEGIATYVEHIARAQAGLTSAEEVWRELVRELPEGQPGHRDDGGLNDTPSEGRRYWGGAIFCLIADIEIRKATGNRLGLQDALRALQRQGGSLARMWSLDRTLQVADAATGTAVLTTLYRKMGNRPHVTDLDLIWRDLGVRMAGGRIALDDAAPLAAIRRAITDRPSAPLLIAEPRLLRVVDNRRISAR